LYLLCMWICLLTLYIQPVVFSLDLFLVFLPRSFNRYIISQSWNTNGICFI
jgi:hypothetical protein